jgi:hypothetical protein
MDSDNLVFKCPAEHADLDFQAELVSKSVKCQVCTVDESDDLDPRKDFVWVKLEWGPNMLSDGAGTTETMIDGYKVYIVDDCERKLSTEPLATVPKSVKAAYVPEPHDCCIGNAYQIVAAGPVPAKGKKFMIVPYQGLLELDAGRTIDIKDKEQGQADIITGALKVTVENPADFAKDDKVRQQLRQAIADILDGIDASMVRIISVDAAGRRLEASVPRKLQGDVVVNYEVLIPPGSQVTFAQVQKNIAELKPDIVKSKLNARLTDHEVTEFTFEEPELSPASNGGSTNDSDAARRTFAVSSFVGLFLACAQALAGLRLV